MSTIAQLLAAGRKLDTAHEHFCSLASPHGDQCDEVNDALTALQSAIDEYRRLLEDITGHHADVILRRLCV